MARPGVKIILLSAVLFGFLSLHQLWPSGSASALALPLEGNEPVCADYNGDGLIDERDQGESEIYCVLPASPAGQPAGGFGSPSGSSGSEVLPGEDLSIQDVFKIITGLACWLSRVVVLVYVAFLIIAGLRISAAQSNPTAYGDAKKNLWHVLTAILVIIGVYVIIATVANIVGVTDFSFIPLKC